MVTGSEMAIRSIITVTAATAICGSYGRVGSEDDEPPDGAQRGSRGTKATRPFSDHEVAVDHVLRIWWKRGRGMGKGIKT